MKAIIITPVGLMAVIVRPKYIAHRDQRKAFLAETKVHLASFGNTFCILRRHCDILNGNVGALVPEGLTFLYTQVFAVDQRGGKLLSMALFLFTQHTIVVENNNRHGAENVGAKGTIEPAP